MSRVSGEKIVYDALKGDTVIFNGRKFQAVFAKGDKCGDCGFDRTDARIMCLVTNCARVRFVETKE
jgi:hypothetical protein